METNILLQMHLLLWSLEQQGVRIEIDVREISKQNIDQGRWKESVQFIPYMACFSEI